MKSTVRKSTYKAIYRLLDRVSPVPFDCGTLCGCACCIPSALREEYLEEEDSIKDSFANSTDAIKEYLEEEDSMGIYLLPGEEKLFSGDEDWLTWNWDDAEDYEFPDSWHGKVPFISCNTPPVCERSMRPIQCRTFPVAPHLIWSYYSDTVTSETAGYCSRSKENDPDANEARTEQLILILSDMQTPYTCPLIEANSYFSTLHAEQFHTEKTHELFPNGTYVLTGTPQFHTEKSHELFPTDPGSDDISFRQLKLDERFLRATYTIWNRLIKDPLIHDLVKMDSEDRDFFVPVFPEHRF